MSDLEIFKLGITLAQALQGDEYAIANLKTLFERHPEMFKSLDDLREIIAKTALKPEIIMPNEKPLGKDIEIIAAKRLDSRKMGDIGVRNENGTNKIFHANKTRISNFQRLEKKALEIVAGGRDAHTPYTQAQSLDGRLVQKNISPATDKNIISQSLLNNLKECENINQFARDLTLIIKQNPNQDVKFYNDLIKDTKLKVDLTKINEEKFTNAINSLKENKTALMEALIKTNLKSIGSNLKLDNSKGLNNV